MKKDDLNTRLNNFKDRIMTEVPNIPLQSVMPVAKKTVKKVTVVAEKDLEVQFGIQLPKSVLKRVKLLSVEKEITIKQIILTSIHAYLDKHESK